MSVEDQKWRRLLWLYHGCPRDALYGDDGEMSCSVCMIDFKRESPGQIQHGLSNPRSAKTAYGKEWGRS